MRRSRKKISSSTSRDNSNSQPSMAPWLYCFFYHSLLLFFFHFFQFFSLSVSHIMFTILDEKTKQKKKFSFIIILQSKSHCCCDHHFFLFIFFCPCLVTTRFFSLFITQWYRKKIRIKNNQILVIWNEIDGKKLNYYFKPNSLFLFGLSAFIRIEIFDLPFSIFLVGLVVWFLSCLLRQIVNYNYDDLRML